MSNYTIPNFSGDDYDEENCTPLTPEQLAARDAAWPEFTGADKAGAACAKKILTKQEQLFLDTVNIRLIYEGFRRRNQDKFTVCVNCWGSGFVKRMRCLPCAGTGFVSSLGQGAQGGGQAVRYREIRISAVIEVLRAYSYEQQRVYPKARQSR